jgi:hypothetical protein
VTEAVYQKQLIKKLKQLFIGCIVLKNDSAYIQGMPDLTVFWGDRWATLEVKASNFSPYQRNQKYYVEQMHDMSFSAFIYPENEEEVLLALQEAFTS